MSKSDTRYPLDLAQGLASSLIDAIGPDAVERIAVAGSIRRARPDVGDIDLVVIPRIEQSPAGLLGECEPVDRLRERLHNLDVRSTRVQALSIRSWGEQVIGGEWAVLGESMPVQIYVTDAARWAMTLFLRTGSEAHNVTLAAAAKARGYKLSVSQGRLICACTDERFARDVALEHWPDVPLSRDASQADFEAAVHHALGLAWLPPSARDPGPGRWVRPLGR